MPLLMVRNNILNIRADAIVNPVNEYLLGKDRLSIEICQAAGEESLKKACEVIGHCDLGQAVATDAFLLNAKYIIHAVVPEWNNDDRNKEQFQQTLYNAYKNSMLLAEEKQCESIVFPFLLSSNFECLKNIVSEIAISAARDFLMEHEMLVYLVLNDEKQMFINPKLFIAMERYIGKHYTEKKEKELDVNVKQPKSKQSPDLKIPAFVQRIIEIKKKFKDSFEDDEYEDEENTKENIKEDTKEDIKEDTKENRLCNFHKPSKSMQGKCASPTRECQTRLDNLMNNLGETFSQMLLRLIDERGLKDSYVYKKANIDRRHFSKIKNNKNYMPTKKTVISFAIALELTLDETIDFMSKAGYAFSNCSKFDVIIYYFLENQSYDIFQINEVLFAYGQSTLGE